MSGRRTSAPLAVLLVLIDDDSQDDEERHCDDVHPIHSAIVFLLSSVTDGKDKNNFSNFQTFLAKALIFLRQKLALLRV